MKWSKKLTNPGEVSASPVAGHDNVIYAPVHKGTDPESGYGVAAIMPDNKELWNHEFKEKGQRLFSSFALSGDGMTIYVLTGVGGKETHLVSLDSASGAVRFAVKAEGDAHNRSRIAVAKTGDVYFVNESGLYAVGPDGRFLWKYSIKADPSLAVVYSPVLSRDEKDLYVIMCCQGRDKEKGGHFIASFDSSAGKIKWKAGQGLYQTSPNEIYATIAIDPLKGTIYASSMAENRGLSGFVYAFNPGNGALKWSYKADDGDMDYVFPSVASDGTLYITTGTSPSNSAAVIALDLSGRLKWKYKAAGARFAQHPITIDKEGKIYLMFEVLLNGAPTKDTGLYCIDKNGNLVFKYHIDDKFWGMRPLLTQKGIIYIFSESGRIYSLRQ
ncbi:MAG: PQQ-like beta-propeller repeat protein [Candidatus Omnitrophica bacterium]|nr:PQQ-like beta-propeller repeat protein [Candidatus Omnitrophota bacterium]